MNIGGGEAADQMVRMMLSGGEVAVRLSGSAAKNLLAMSLALAKSHKKLSGKVRMGKMLQETRDIRVFPMTPEQYHAFRKTAGRQKLLYAAIKDISFHGHAPAKTWPASGSPHPLRRRQFPVRLPPAYHRGQ